MFDSFARKCNLLDHPLPAMAKISYSYENTFIINIKLCVPVGSLM